MRASALLLALALSCAGRPPAWTSAGRHADFDDARFLRAVGVAPVGPDAVAARKDADLRAFAGIAEQIRVGVASAESSYQSEGAAGAHTSFSALVQTWAAESLSALRIVERWEGGEERTA